jgi:hypothetical protein
VETDFKFYVVEAFPNIKMADIVSKWDFFRLNRIRNRIVVVGDCRRVGGVGWDWEVSREESKD